MATANYPNSLNFRSDREGPLSWSEMDNMFRQSNNWSSDVKFEQGMVVVWDDSLPPVSGASGALSSWICNTPHISATSYAPGTTYGYWSRIGVPSGAYIGPTGPTGLQGIQGTRGPTGLQGIQGPTGPQGIQGNNGPQGIQGRQGTKGDPGIQGATGIQGSTGPQGIQGTEGPTGVQGIQGPTGTQGYQGIQGTYGPTGVTGIQGATGIQGIQGPTGTQGIQGNSGSPILDPIDSINYYIDPEGETQSITAFSGYNVIFDTSRGGATAESIDVEQIEEPGSTLISFNQVDKYFITYTLSAYITGSPTGRTQFESNLCYVDSGLGVSDIKIDGFKGVVTLDVNGQSNTYTNEEITVSGYLNITEDPIDWINNRKIYVRIDPFSGSTITLIPSACSITVIRLRGSAGPTGPTGIQGSNAEVQGIQGIQGPTGQDGIQGPTGSGSQGIQGNASTVQGYQGIQGSGSQGIQGGQGIQGNASSVQGYQGIQGPTGSGSQGIQGTFGPTGIQGPTGQQGIQGIQGNASSVQGYQGIQGSSGPTGSGSSAVTYISESSVYVSNALSNVKFFIGNKERGWNSSNVSASNESWIDPNSPVINGTDLTCAVPLDSLVSIENLEDCTINIRVIVVAHGSGGTINGGSDSIEVETYFFMPGDINVTNGNQTTTTKTSGTSSGTVPLVLSSNNNEYNAQAFTTISKTGVTLNPNMALIIGFRATNEEYGWLNSNPVSISYKAWVL